jgi:hypothetical protein
MILEFELALLGKNLTKMNVGQRCTNEGTIEHLENSFLSTLEIPMVSIKKDAIASTKKIKLIERGD